MSDKKLKTVLIISYYWPPAGGPGVQRVLKFTKYLPQFGWRPIILTVKNGEYPAIDNSLINDVSDNIIVHKTSSFEPSGLYRKFVGMKNDEAIPVAVLTENNPSLKKRISNWIRANLFIPDAKIGWKPIAVRHGKKMIKEHQPDIIFSTSPPPTVHLIARVLSKWSKIPWVADFRDPWTNIYHYHLTPKNRLAKQIDLKKEKSVLNRAHKIITVTDGFFSDIDRTKATVIPNGFDPEDYSFPEGNPSDSDRNIFTIAYMGSYKVRQHVETFYQVLSNIQKQYPETKEKIQLKFIGNINQHLREQINAATIGLKPIFTGYLDHTAALTEAKKSDLLLLIIGKSHIDDRILTGKLFEYLMLRKPILAYGPINGAAHRVLDQTRAGNLFRYDDLKGPENFILNHFMHWKNNESNITDLSRINQYNRKHLTKQLANIFEELL